MFSWIKKLMTTLKMLSTNQTNNKGFANSFEFSENCLNLLLNLNKRENI